MSSVDDEFNIKNTMFDSNKEVMLTTFDNPFDPFTRFDEWLEFDFQKGTDCCGYISRVVDSFNEEINEFNEESITLKAIETIVKSDPITFIAVHPNDKRYDLTPEEFHELVIKVMKIMDVEDDSSDEE